MKAEAQRIAIAEACGWRRGANHWKRLAKLRFNSPSRLPDYLNDLNAMHEAEKVLTMEQRNAYFFTLNTAVSNGEGFWHLLHATAAQRAEALLRTLGKWEDGQ